jgi:ABC-type antimicrobial peptide transport system permease subunit
MVLSGFDPVIAIKSEVSTRNLGGVQLRKGLVVFQFVIAQALIVGAIISLQQMRFIQNIDLGFRKDLIYIFPMDNTSESRTRMHRLKEQILLESGVESMTMTNLPPASNGSWQTNFSIGRGTTDQPFNTSYLLCDEDFQKTFDLQLLAGKWYKPSDTITGYVINETLMRKVGISDPQDAVGKELRLENDPWFPVVGVVKDFHSKPLQSGFEPLVLASYLSQYAGAGVKIQPININSTIAGIKKIFDETYPEQIFRGSFFDETIADFYASEDRFARSCSGFSLLAIIISCLGLLGLSAHSAQRRRKEIGIRKILGATTGSVVGLLSRDFIALVLISLIIATPLTYFFMEKWLQDFAYRVNIQWWVFCLTGFLVIGIAFVAVSFQSIRAALINPVDSLRNE